jgi:hypothetical protein
VQFVKVVALSSCGPCGVPDVLVRLFKAHSVISSEIIKQQTYLKYIHSDFEMFEYKNLVLL